MAVWWWGGVVGGGVAEAGCGWNAKLPSEGGKAGDDFRLRKGGLKKVGGGAGARVVSLEVGK